jgi:hypothetical protein
LVAPGPVQLYPAEQGVQAVAPVVDEKVPGGQMSGLTNWITPQLEPAGHGVQDDADGPE